MKELTIRDDPILKHQRINLLQKVCSVLNENDINYFLTCGTLLGYIRENDFIEWDTDIDIGLFDISEVLKLKNHFWKLGLSCNQKNSYHFSPKLHIIDKELDVDSEFHVDLYEFENTNDGIIFKFSVKPAYVEIIRKVVLEVVRVVFKPKYPRPNSVFEIMDTSGIPITWKQWSSRLQEWIKKNFYKQGIHIFEPFTSVKVLWFGTLVKIPSSPIDHLRLLYGDEWDIPQPNYKRSKERQRNVRRVKL